MFIPNFPIDVWKLTVLATIPIIVAIVIVVVIFVVVVVATWSFLHIVSRSANRNYGSSRKVPGVEEIELPPFMFIYDLVNYKIQYQEVRECAFINESKGGVEGGLVDLPL
jgi:hypothetical protein